MNRRGFIQGLGALMASSAMVRPAVADVAWSTTPFEYGGMWFNYSIPPLPNGDYVSITHPSMFADLKREWEGATYEMQRGLFGDGPTHHKLNKLREIMFGSDRWPCNDSCCQMEEDPDDDDEVR